MKLSSVVLFLVYARVYLCPDELDRGGADHKQGPLGAVVAHDGDGLQCLPQPHVVSQQHATTVADAEPAGVCVCVCVCVCAVFKSQALLKIPVSLRLPSDTYLVC